MTSTARQRRRGTVQGATCCAHGIVLILWAFIGASRVMALSDSCQIAKLIPADVSAFDGTGSDVAAAGVVMAAGAPYARVVSPNTGKIYVFRKEDGRWREDATLVALGGVSGGGLGTSVAAVETSTGWRIVAGAPYASCAGDTDCGEAFVFDDDGTGWVQKARLGPDFEDFQLFGEAVAVEGDRIVVGAPRTGGAQGAAYIFERQGELWQRTARLSPSIPTGYFGISVALEGDVLVVGAERDTEFGPSSGAVFVFVHQLDGTWLEVQKLTASDAVTSALFGDSVSISDERILVGATQGIDTPGQAYVFERVSSDGPWAEVALLQAPNPAGRDVFGGALTLRHDIALIGALNYNGGTGAAFSYRRTESGWVLEDCMTPVPDGVVGAFGSGVSITDENYVSGAWVDGTAGQQAGSVSVMLRDEVIDGNVDRGSGAAGATDVLFVNGQTGNACNVVTVSSGIESTISVVKAPQGNGAYAFWIYDFRRYAGVPIQYRKGGTTYDLGSGVKALPINNSVMSGSVSCPLTFPIGWTSQSLGSGAAGAFCLNSQPGFPRAPTSFNVIFPPGNFILGGLVTDQNSINSPALNVSIANWIFVRSR